jgi:hypothetical protein
MEQYRTGRLAIGGDGVAAEIGCDGAVRELHAQPPSLSRTPQRLILF